MASHQELEQYASSIFRECEIAFSPNSSNQDRQKASLFLQNIGEQDARFLYIIEQVLKSTDKPDILILFANLGLKTITKFWSSLEDEFLLNFRDFIITHLRDSNLHEPGVVNCLSRIPCRITKLGWTKNARFKALTPSIATFLSKDKPTCNKGLLILSVFIDEMNAKLSIETTKHRKIATDFRDTELHNIFALSIEVLKRILSSQDFAPGQQNDNSFIESAIKLTYKCLNFDFIGTINDEASSEFGSIQIPIKWKSSLNISEDDGNAGNHIVSLVYKILFAIINSNIQNPNIKSKYVSDCLQLMNSLALVRRSLFSDSNSKSKYFSMICKGTIEILSNYIQIMNDLEVFNSFCRLLISIKVNCTISYLIKLDIYQIWVDNIASFTIKAFNLHDSTSNGIHFLLQLWSKFSNSIIYFRGNTPSFLSSFIPKITLEFLDANLNHLLKMTKEGNSLETLLSTVEMNSINQFLPAIFSFSYQKSVNWVQEKFGAHFNTLKTLSDGSASLESQNIHNLKLVEVQVSWIVYVISIVISDSAPGFNKENDKSLDAILCSMGFQLIAYTNYRADLMAKGVVEATPLLEKAILSFFSNFQKSYMIRFLDSHNIIGETKKNPFLVELSKSMGKQVNQKDLHDIIITKLLSNLCYWTNNKEILEDTLEILSLYNKGYDSFKLTSELDIIQNILKNHTEQFRVFLSNPQNSRLRSDFYKFIGKFAFTDRMTKNFLLFMAPFDSIFTEISNATDFTHPNIKLSIIGLCRDLKGILSSATRRNHYRIFYEWFYSNHYNTFLMLFEVLSVTPQVATPMLRFLDEFVFNKGGRISFPISSPEGIDLFRSVKKAISIYISRLMGYTVDMKDESYYLVKVKGTMISLSIMTKLLSGNYVSFGAFEAFKDNSVKEVVTDIISLVHSLSIDSIYNYPKLTAEYYEMVETISDHHLNLFSNFSEDTIEKILVTLNDGIQSTFSTHSIRASNSLGSWCSAIIVERKKSVRAPGVQNIEKVLNKNSELLLKLVSAIFHTILFENPSNMFSLSRALSVLLAFNPQLLKFYASILIKAQPPENAESLQKGFMDLVDLVENRDEREQLKEKFSQTVLRLKMLIGSNLAVPVF